jgi:hypothetical protein
VGNLKKSIHLITGMVVFILFFQLFPSPQPVQGGSPRFPDFIAISDRSFPEDSGMGGGLVNLSYHFQDNGSKQIAYELIQETDPTHIDGQINGKMVDFIQVVENWTGKANFQVMGTDLGPDGFYGTGDDVVRTSNFFNVTITPVNDPPLITTVDTQNVDSSKLIKLTLYEDSEYNITFGISEADGEPVEISTNLTLANLALVQPMFGGPHIRFKPTNWDVGPVYLSVTATDITGFTDTVELELTVENTNDPPRAYIDTPGEGLVIVENVPVIFTGSRSSDDDVPHGDVLTYKWESNISGLLSTSSTFESALNIGHHRIQLTVIDQAGRTAQSVVNLTVVPETKIEITGSDPDSYLIMLTTETRQNFEIWAQGTSIIEPSYEWYLDDEKVFDDGPASTSDFELDLRYIDHYVTHEVRVIAYDEGAYTSLSWTLIFQDLAENKPPTITPGNSVIKELELGDKVTLEIDASDPDGDSLSYKWTVDGKLRQGSTGKTFTLKPSDLGKYEVTVTVSDDSAEVSYTWNVVVNEPITPQLTTDDDSLISTSKESDENENLQSWVAIVAVLIVIMTILFGLAIVILRRKSGEVPPPQAPLPPSPPPQSPPQLQFQPQPQPPQQPQPQPLQPPPQEQVPQQFYQYQGGMSQ